MRVLVAGDRGYIGAVLVPFPRAAGHEVGGLDLGLYEGCDLGQALTDADRQPPRDIRDVVPAHLAGYLDDMLHRQTSAQFPPAGADTGQESR
jgi:nucleoside-diphosphate-sugar epimerase